MLDSEMFAELVAREEIRSLLIEYVQCADTGRTDRMLELFAPDAVMEATNDPVCHGRDEIRAYFERAGRSAQAFMAKPYLRHHLSSISPAALSWRPPGVIVAKRRSRPCAHMVTKYAPALV